MIQRPRQREHPGTADAAIRWLQADDAAETGGRSNRRAGITAQAGGAQAGCDGGRCSTARTAWDAVRVPWIAHRAVMWVFAGDTEREFVQVVLAENDRACRLEATDDRRVVRRDIVAENC